MIILDNNIRKFLTRVVLTLLGVKNWVSTIFFPEINNKITSLQDKVTVLEREKQSLENKIDSLVFRNSEYVSELEREKQSLENKIDSLLFRNSEYEKSFTEKCTDLAQKTNELLSITETYTNEKEILMQSIMAITQEDNSHLDRFTYGDIFHLIEEAVQKNDRNSYSLEINVYREIMRSIHKNNICAKKNKKVKVIFLVCLVSTWSCEQIYLLMKNRRDLFEPTIVIVPHEVADHETNIAKYNEVCAYFKDNGYEFLKGYNTETKEYISFKTMGDPDVIFHFTPYIKEYYNESYQINKIPIKTLNIYMPYGFHVAKLYKTQFNLPLHNISWKIYCDMSYTKELAEENCFVGSFNMEVSGNPKADNSYGNSITLKNQYWKTTDKTKYKIIYAPHHSVDNNMTGTFRDNYEFFYQLAKETEDISWIIKPHPLLRTNSLRFDLFEKLSDYDDYIRKWCSLPNASFVDEEDYCGIFATSDAIILDSISFLAEYMYYHKPQLFLTKISDNYNLFNAFGNELLESLYQTSGSDFSGIRTFIDEVVKSNVDPKKAKREEIFREFLDYRAKNGVTASEYIFDQLVEIFFEAEAK